MQDVLEIWPQTHGRRLLDPDNSPRHIQETRRYIQDFIRPDERD